jgi:hypothetical protein
VDGVDGVDGVDCAWAWLMAGLDTRRKGSRGRRHVDVEAAREFEELPEAEEGFVLEHVNGSGTGRDSPSAESV